MRGIAWVRDDLAAIRGGLKPGIEIEIWNDAHCCQAWNKFTDQSWRITSIGLRDWTHGVQSMSVGMRLCRLDRNRHANAQKSVSIAAVDSCRKAESEGA